MSFVKKYNIIRRHLGNRGVHLNEYGAPQVAINYIATIRKLWKSVGHPGRSSDVKPTESTKMFLKFLKPLKVIVKIIGHLNLIFMRNKFDMLPNTIKETFTS